MRDERGQLAMGDGLGGVEAKQNAKHRRDQGWMYDAAEWDYEVGVWVIDVYVVNVSRL